MPGTVFAGPIAGMSPKDRVTAMNSGMIRISAPSIPSKYLTPFIDYQTLEQAASNVVLQHEFCQMSKLYDDGSKVGPGSYNVSGNMTD